jgi:hypothetical protein
MIKFFFFSLQILEEQNNGVQHIIQVLEADTTEIDNISKAWRGDQKHQFY